jgi:hypothetical protein
MIFFTRMIYFKKSKTNTSKIKKKSDFLKKTNFFAKKTETNRANMERREYILSKMCL